MALTFHWFLPTTGDGRSIMGRGHSLPPAGPPAAPAGGRLCPRPMIDRPSPVVGRNQWNVSVMSRLQRCR